MGHPLPCSQGDCKCMLFLIRAVSVHYPLLWTFLSYIYVASMFFCSSPGILRQPLHFARERETFWYLFRLCTPYGSRVSLTGEEEEEEEERRRKKKENDDFFKIRYLSFCTAELKSEDIFVLRRVRAFSGYSFCWLNLLSKHFNHPHPYIEIATAISDY